MISLVPDEVFVGTSAFAERYLAEFVFSGPGWYLIEKNTILAMPMDRNRDCFWNHEWIPEEKFLFQIFIGRDPREDLKLVASAPERIS